MRFICIIFLSVSLMTSGCAKIQTHSSAAQEEVKVKYEQKEPSKGFRLTTIFLAGILYAAVLVAFNNSIDRIHDK